jgi:hypothetical protein
MVRTGTTKTSPIQSRLITLPHTEYHFNGLPDHVHWHVMFLKILTARLLLITQSTEMRPYFQGVNVGAICEFSEKFYNHFVLVPYNCLLCIYCSHRWHTLLMTYTVNDIHCGWWTRHRILVLFRFMSYFHYPRDVWFTFSIAWLLIRDFILLTRSLHLHYPLFHYSWSFTSISHYSKLIPL